MRTTIAIIAGALALSGCASQRAQRQPAPAPAPEPTAEREGGMQDGMMGGQMAEMCPMAVEGTTARAEDVEGGVAMVLTTTGDVADLRRRAERMAEMHNLRHAEGTGMSNGGEPHRGQGGMHGRKGMMNGGMMMPPATARTEEVEGGVRMVFTPRDPADLPMLREQVQRRAERMVSGECPMMSPPEEGAEPAEGDHDAHHPEGT